ncbi:unnamed protein product, partial [Leptidea sinapis]
ISILVRNKAYSLPYFLSSLLNLDYPKERIYVWFYSDFNSDNSNEILKDWIKMHSKEYNKIYITMNTTSGFKHEDQETPTHWSDGRFRHVIELRESALKFATLKWADYIFMLDADILLTNTLTLKHLVSKGYPISSPMLMSASTYSNFWCGMDEYYYYKRTDEYKPILFRKSVGCFDVPMVHSAVLINLKHKSSELLTYVPEKLRNYDGPVDDIIVFAVGAQSNDIPIMICNDFVYGFLPVPLEKYNELEDEKSEFVNTKVEILGNGIIPPLNNDMEKYVEPPIPDNLDCTEIFMINLKRRTKRRVLMENSFKELGLNVTYLKAFDGKTISKTFLEKYDITLLPEYEDPYHKRPMKTGEIGCFLSHFVLWQRIVDEHLDVTLILEDDVHFVPDFRRKFLRILDEVKSLDWDFLYIGRKILMDGEEEYVTDHTTKPLYSYWTLGYVIKERGAKKLLAADPLSKLIPVDEFIPIMFNQHPSQELKQHFPVRTLKALSASPLLVHPTHYVGDIGYISDTEDSIVV